MNLIKKLEGKKTYIVAVAIAIVNLLTVFGVEINPEQIKAINMLLGALGLLFLRKGVQKAGEPMRAAQALADGLIGGLTPPRRPWFGLVPKSKKKDAFPDIAPCGTAPQEEPDEFPPTQEEKDFFK